MWQRKIDRPGQWRYSPSVTAIALPDFERDVRAALERVGRGESLVVLEHGQRIAEISPPASDGSERVPDSMLDFFLCSPLRDSGLVIERDGSSERGGFRF